MGDFDSTLGPVVIGVFVNTYLYGFAMIQYAAYKNTKYNDPAWIKAIILVLFCIDTFHSAAAIYMIWVYCVRNFLNPEILHVSQWPMGITPICTAISGAVAHIFLGHRSYRLTGSKTIYWLIFFLALPTFVLSIAASGWRLHKHVPLLDLPSGKGAVNTAIVISWLAVQSGVDLFIAGILLHALYKMKPVFRAGDIPMNRVLKALLQTGVLAAAFSFADLVTFAAASGTGFFGLLAIPIGRIYSNSLLDTLTSREPVVDKGKGRSTSVVQSQSGRQVWLTGQAGPNQQGRDYGIQTIRIKTKTEVHTDANSLAESLDLEKSDPIHESFTVPPNART